MTKQLPPALAILSSLLGPEPLRDCVIGHRESSTKTAYSLRVARHIGESEKEEVGRGTQQVLETGGLAKPLPSALRSNRDRRGASPPCSAKRSSKPDPRGRAPGRRRLARRYRASRRGIVRGWRGLCAARRCAPFGAARRPRPRDEIENDSGEKGVEARESAQILRAAQPRSDGGSTVDGVLVDGLGGPVVYGAIKLAVDLTVVSPVLAVGADTPHCGLFREFCCGGDHV